jgi:catechol 2,3-dioxygenase-like lactoylglutathione lyase family enzyme
VSAGAVREQVAIESLSAVTLFTRDMARAVRFYSALGFEIIYGGAHDEFASFRAGSGFLNVALGRPPETPWGRAIFYVSDVDAMYRRVLACGFAPRRAPADASWGERYFHLRDEDGNELSFARPLARDHAA